MKRVGWLFPFALAVLVMFGASRCAAQGSTLLVSNVRMLVTNGLVRVIYDLATVDGQAVTVRLNLSTDGGQTFPYLCQTVDGDVGGGILPGAGRQIVWNATADFPNLNSEQCRLRVSADDDVTTQDTFTVVFTTQDPTNVIYPTGATHLDSLRVQGLTAAIGSADAVYRLGTGFDVPTFAYSEIDRPVPDGYKDPNGVSVGMNCDGATLVNNGRFLNLHFPQATRRSELVYIPWQDFIPPHATILSAAMDVQLNTGAYYGFRDSVVAVQMSNPADNQWYQVKGVGSNYPDFAHASWNRQQSSNGGAWGGPDAHPWTPSLDDRKFLWAWGEINDWSGSTNETPTGLIPTYSSMSIKLTNCVQAAVNGDVNNGVILSYAENNSFAGSYKHYHWDDYSSARGRTPYVVVKYRNTPYVKPFGTSDWTFIANTDDGKFPCNNAYTDIFLAHGGKYTIFMAKNQISTGTGASTPRQLIDFHTRGMEVGNHSRYHREWGLTYWSRQMTMPDTNSAAWDSLMFDAGPVWMYNMADTIVGDLRNDPTFAKSFALPTNSWSPESLLALAKFRYVAVRTNASSSQYNRDRYYTLATQRASKTDTISTGMPTQFGRRPRNMTMLPPFDWAPTIVGYKGNPALTEASLDSIRHNAHRVIFQLRGQDRRALHLFWHDFKTNPSGNGYGEGLNANELDALLDVVDELGGRYMTTSEYANWIKDRATPVATPAGYAQPDTFKFQASDRVWFVPDE